MWARLLLLGVGLAGCAPAPPGANNPETHRGATVIAPGGTPGTNGPYHLEGLAPVGAHSL